VPAIKPAAELSRSRVIGVLGTEATVRQPYVSRLAERFAADCTMLRFGCAELVDLAESKLRGEPQEFDGYRRSLEGLISQPRGQEMDSVVLACTHFPLVAEELAAASPWPLAFVDGKEGIARRTAWLTREITWPEQPGDGVALFTRWDPKLEVYRRGLAEYGLRLVEGSGRA
jgi:glutamate racemase